VIRVNFLNDHFDRISRGRQILVYGDHPFADFRDPGYFLTLYVSAAAQAVSGGGLIGELVVTSAAIAAAGTVTFYLAAAASGSLTIALLAACLTVVVSPRYYDYDKVFFYMAGLALCWRYVDAPGEGRLAAAAVVSAAASLFRYDNGLYLMAACTTAIAVRHWRAPGRLVRDLAVYVAVVIVTLVPALLFVHLTIGIPEAFRQIATYAAVEGRRSDLFKPPPLRMDQTFILYVLTLAIGPVALLHLGFRAREKRRVLPFAAAKVVAAAVLCACVCVFVLRDPISARIGAAVPIVAVLAAAIAGQWRGQAGVIPVVALVVCAGALVVMFAQRDGRLLLAPSIVAARLRALTSDPAGSPPRPGYVPDNGALGALASYLRRCTAPDARVLVASFAPEVFFSAQRGFAGGMAVFLGTHWSSEADQRRTVKQMTGQIVPVAIVPVGWEEEFRSTFRHVAAHLDEEYRLGGTTTFGDPRVAHGAYRVFIRRDAGNVPVAPEWRLPCPQPQHPN
jgi:hypothetical protein